MDTPAHDTADPAASGTGAFDAPFAAALNHLLGRAEWARTRLAPFAGKRVRIDAAPVTLTLEIAVDGTVATGRGEPDVVCCVSPGLALRMAAGDDNAWREAAVDGDTALAREVLYLAQNLRWDVEEDLSRVFGDIIAHRLAGAGRAFARWQRDTLDALARQSAAYWTEEQPLIASRALIEQFGRDVDTLRDDLARAEKRIEQLEQRRRS